MPYLNAPEQGATFVRIVLSSGNHAVYEVDSLKLSAAIRSHRAEFVRMFGRQRAHQALGVWFKPGKWVRIAGASDEFAALPLIED